VYFIALQDMNSKMLHLLTFLAKFEVGKESAGVAAEYIVYVKTMVPQLQLVSRGIDVEESRQAFQ
jgi:hypothetical protein